MSNEPLTVKKFMLKKFPTDEYMDCPVGRNHWETIQEYAEAYHLSISPSKEQVLDHSPLYSREQVEKAVEAGIKWQSYVDTDVEEKDWYYGEGEDKYPIPPDKETFIKSLTPYSPVLEEQPHPFMNIQDVKDAFNEKFSEHPAQEGSFIALLKEYEQWEADLIADNAMWWPNVPKDRISGKTYDKMIELQAKRNELLNSTPAQEGKSKAYDILFDALHEQYEEPERHPDWSVLINAMYKLEDSYATSNGGKGRETVEFCQCYFPVFYENDNKEKICPKCGKIVSEEKIKHHSKK